MPLAPLCDEDLKMFLYSVTMGTLGELEFPQPWSGLQGHTGGKGKSCEGPGPSLARGFFKVNKRLLFILKALMCVDGAENPPTLLYKAQAYVWLTVPPGMSWEIKPMGMNRGPLGTVPALSQCL